MSNEEFNVLNIGEEKKEQLKEMHLSDQALGAVMMALQKSLLEQSDIVPVLKGFKFVDNQGDLVVLNPPTVKLDHDDADVLEQALETD
jgi:predicted RNA methylase